MEGSPKHIPKDPAASTEHLNPNGTRKRKKIQPQPSRVFNQTVDPIGELTPIIRVPKSVWKREPRERKDID